MAKKEFIMLKHLSLLSCTLLLMFAPLASANKLIVTPFVGYTFGGAVEDENQNTFDLNAAPNYAIAIETLWIRDELVCSTPIKARKWMSSNKIMVSTIYTSKAAFTIQQILV